MDNNLKKKIWIAVIIVSIAVVFIPVYFFALADAGDDGNYTLSYKKIIAMEDGTGTFDLDDSAGNDSSEYNNIVRTFDTIKYTVGYRLIKTDQSASNDIDGRNLLVEVLIPTSYYGVLEYSDVVSINIRPNSEPVTIINRDGNDYFYASFNVPVAALDVDSSFDFKFSNINTDDITTHNVIKPLVFVKESTEQNEVTPSVLEGAALSSAIPCDMPAVIDPDTSVELRSASNEYSVTLSGKEDYFVNMYTGNKKTDENDISKVPVGLLVGLRDQGNGKGIKGLVVPTQVSFVISNSDTSKLSYVDNTLADYTGYQGINDYEIDMPIISNGTVSGSINNSNLNVSISNIGSYILNKTNSGMYYFASKYFVTQITRSGDFDYSDINVSLICNKNNSDNQQSGVSIVDSYDFVLGNYSSSIDLYERTPDTGTSTSALEYGKANINYGSNYTFNVNFSYNSRSDTQGNALTSLVNYVKIDNTALKLYENHSSNASHEFISDEVISVPSIKLNTDQNGNLMVYFGFGEWNSTYFESTGACSNIDVNSLTKEQLMNLYGGPCIVENSNVQWAYSPESSDDINGQQITTEKGPMIVKSVYVTNLDNTDGYIVPGSGGTLQLYGSVIDDYRVANNVYQIVTSGIAYGKNNNDKRYLGNENISGEALLSNAGNFIKTTYDFTNRTITSLNSNSCANVETPSKCAASGVSIITSGLRSTAPAINAYKSTNLNTPATDFYHYPIALKVDSNSIKNDDSLIVRDILVDIYLPNYMYILENYGVGTDATPVGIEDVTLASIYAKAGLGTPSADANYKVYHYSINENRLTDFVVYVDIDSVNTPASISPEIFATTDFIATKSIEDENEQQIAFNFSPITSDAERTSRMVVNLHNSSPVITKGATLPKYIEKNGSYTFNMFAYNHSATLVENGYTYPTADLYYILPYNGDISDEYMTSKVGSTKYKVNFTEESINGIANINDYKFYYATTGVPSNIISDEISVTSDPSSIWTLWENPTEPVSNVIAIKVVKQSAFAPGEYFASTDGLTVNVETSGTSEGNIFYNKFSLLTTKPANYECDTTVNLEDESENDPNTCEESRQTKDNYSPTPSATSIYSREISGFVFEDSDYDGIFTAEEPRIKDIAVSLYKIETLPENFDETDPSTYVSDTDKLVGSTLTGINGNYYFGGIAPGNYYVRFTFNNDKYTIADYGRLSDYIPNSNGNNSKALLIPSSNKAVTKIITFSDNYTDGNNIVNGMNMGLAVKKEMAVQLSKFITEVTVSKNGNVTKYDYSDKNLSQVSITVLNPKDTHIQVKYAFSIENTKYFPGYVGLIVDSIPKDMTFNPELEENANWAIYDNTLYYNGLSGKLLLPNEKQYFKLVLDLDLKEAGTYKNVITAKDLTIMGNELPVYDFGTNNALGGE